MSVILFLLMGLVVGAIARFIVPGKERGGMAISMIIGVAGALLGGLVGRAVGLYREGESAGFLVSLIGAVVLVAGYHAVARRRAIV